MFSVFDGGILMCVLFGRGTPREPAREKRALSFIAQTEIALALAMKSTGKTK
jgi:hypothetical protein